MSGQGEADFATLGSILAKGHAPSADRLDDRLETIVVSVKFVPRQTVEPAEHVQKH